MTRLRIVSIIHPAYVGKGERLDMLDDVDVSVLAPDESGAAEAEMARRINMPTRGRGRFARFPSLPAALTMLNPAIVHLQADPDTLLARDASQLCGMHAGRGLVLDSAFDGSTTLGPMAAFRARRTLARTDAAIVRSEPALAALQRLGFGGQAVVAGPRFHPAVLPGRKDARRMLQVPAETALVAGWAGPLDKRSGILDLLEAIAMTDGTAVVIASGRPGVQDVRDRADALEILPRVRFAASDVEDLTLGGIDVVVTSLPRNAREQAACMAHIELAQACGIPSIHCDRPELSSLSGRGGWPVLPGDPALLARLLSRLGTEPSLLRAGAQAAASLAAQRHLPELAANDLARVLRAADPAYRSRQTFNAGPGWRFADAFRRSPSRT